MRQHPAKPLDEILEKELQKQIVDLATMLGYKRAYHTYDSRRSQTGFPDLVLVRDRVIFLELKREPKVATPITDAQKDWLRSLDDAGAEVYIVRPRHLQAVADVLAARRDRQHGHLITEPGRKAETELRQELRREIAA